MADTPASLDFEVDQGSLLSADLLVLDGAGQRINFTGLDVRMHVRRDVGAAQKILDLRTSNGGLIALSGEFNLRVSITKAQADRIAPGEYVQDGRIQGFPVLWAGKFTVTPRSTR